MTAIFLSIFTCLDDGSLVLDLSVLGTVCFEGFDLGHHVDEIIDVIVSVDQTGLLVRVDIKSFRSAGGSDGNGLCGQVDIQFSFRICFDGLENFPGEGFAELPGEKIR